jgi:hypothetical protein
MLEPTLMAADRFHLRHELQAYARTQLEPGLSLCAFVNGAVGGGTILDIPSQGLVEIERLGFNSFGSTAGLSGLVLCEV